MNTSLLEAATARRAAVAAPADRPSRRRCAEHEGSLPLARVRVRELELRDDGGSGGMLSFRGYASVTDAGYQMYDYFGPYTELVAPGAFTKTLATDGLDVPLVLQHQDLRRIARTTNGTLRLTEDDTGLLVEADLDPDDADVQYIAPKLRSGLIDEMSFKFRIEGGQWSPDWMEYHINEVDIHRGDVAIVGYGANPNTAGSGLRSVTSLNVAEVIDSWPDGVARSAQAALTKRFTPAAAPHTPRAVVTDEDTRLRVIR